MTPEEYLEKNYKEAVPIWLENFRGLSTFNAQDFFHSRVVFYPGSGDDGHAVKVFGSSHSAHCFVYSDFAVGVGSLKAALDSLRERFSGYRCIARLDLQEKDILPNGWQSHASRKQLKDWSDHCDHGPSSPMQPYGLLEILEREEGLNESHGAKRLAILFLGADGHATYDALFCQAGQTAPFAVLLQDHGLGGNYSDFGRDGIMNDLAVKTKRTPELLLVDSGETDHWIGFQKIGGLEPTMGGWAGFTRFLYKLVDD